MKTFKQIMNELSESVDDRSHGSPYDRGSADKHYGRFANPHKKDSKGRRITDLTPDEHKAYHKGYNETDDDWDRNG